MDSFVGEVHGYAKQGATFGYPRQRGYHPLLATRADSGEVLHIRLRKGSANSARGALRFVDELIARVTRAGASGPKLLRADSAFWSNRIFERLARAGWQYSIGVRMQPHVRAAIEQIPDANWRPLADYPEGGEAQIAETTLAGPRLIVRRPRRRRPPAGGRSPAAPASSAPKASSSPTGGTSRSSPTAPSRSCSSSQSTASTPSSSSPSATSKTRRWRTFPPASSTPTQRGR